MAKQGKQPKNKPTKKTEKQIKRKVTSKAAAQKTATPKAISKKPARQAPNKGKRRGQKSCQGCGEKIPIHLRVCSYCGAVNNMKKQIHTLTNILSSATPKGLQALLELNQTNALPAPELRALEVRSDIASFISETDDRVAKPSSFKIFTEEQEILASSHQLIEVTESISVFSVSNQLRCVRMRESTGAIAFTEQLDMKADDIGEKDLLTLRVHGLENMLRVSQRYRGQSYIYLMEEPYAECKCRMMLPHLVVQLEWVNDSFLLVLTGEGEAYLQEVPPPKPPTNRLTTYSIKKDYYPRQISAENIAHEAFCVVEVLSGCSQPTAACGDWRGNIYLYELVLGSSPRKMLSRTINAHNGYVTVIKNCPINDTGQVMFASGGYDGYIKVWSTKEINPLLSEEISNRKIMDIQWDTGAKFILALVDDQNEGCILLSLFSSIKVDSCLQLLPNSQFRYIKQLTHYNFVVVNPHLQQAAFASHTGVITFCPVQELRKLSVKRKKCKASEMINGTIAVHFDERGLHIQQESVQQELTDTLDLSVPCITSLDFLKRSNQAVVAVTTSPGILLIYRPLL